MSALLPTFSLPYYSYQITLENEVFTFFFKWNVKLSYWTLDIYNAANEIQVYGVKIVLSFPLIKRYSKAGLPKGELMAIDTTDKLDRIGKDDLGTNVVLVYLNESEIV